MRVLLDAGNLPEIWGGESVCTGFVTKVTLLVTVEERFGKTVEEGRLEGRVT